MYSTTQPTHWTGENILNNFNVKRHQYIEQCVCVVQSNDALARKQADSDADIDSAGEPFADIGQNYELLELAQGASTRVTMMENSFMHLSMPGADFPSTCNPKPKKSQLKKAPKHTPVPGIFSPLKHCCLLYSVQVWMPVCIQTMLACLSPVPMHAIINALAVRERPRYFPQLRMVLPSTSSSAWVGKVGVKFGILLLSLTLVLFICADRKLQDPKEAQILMQLANGASMKLNQIDTEPTPETLTAEHSQLETVPEGHRPDQGDSAGDSTPQPKKDAAP